ncbi:MAG: hypothetical protein QXG39_00250 [Candidatus Aenigmatarchaeota archaeon]
MQISFLLLFLIILIAIILVVISYFLFLKPKPIQPTQQLTPILTPPELLNLTQIIFSNYTNGWISSFYINITSVEWCLVEKFNITFYGHIWECEPYCPSPEEARLKCTSYLPLETRADDIYFPQSKAMIEFEKVRSESEISSLKQLNFYQSLLIIILIGILLILIFKNAIQKYLISFGIGR